jgi:putative ABC transport system permease protein
MSFDIYRRDATLAVRNVIRQGRRSLFALVIIASGVIAMMMAGGFIQWIFDSMREATIRAQLGHVQIVRPGFFEKGLADPYSFLLPQNDPLLATLGKAEGVLAVAPRLIFTGLISHDEATISFAGEGVDPDKETELSKYLVILQGAALSSQDPKGIVIGEGLAGILGVKVGDTVVLLAPTRRGGLSGVECHVRGIFMTATKAYDDAYLRVPLAVAQKLARVSGATSWVVLLDQTSHTDAFIAQEKAQAQRPDIQFVPWHELADFYKKTVTLLSKQVGGVELLIALIIILSISNTLSMSVIERTGEIGTIMALGGRRSGVMRLFVFEGAVLGILGGLIGTVLGSAIGSAVSYVGIPMPPPPGMTRGFDGQIHITVEIIVRGLLLALGTTLLASIFPAWKASRMIIVDALRHQR